MANTRKITLSRRDSRGTKSMAYAIDTNEGAQLTDHMCVNLTITTDEGMQTIRMPRYKLQDMLDQLYT